MPAKTKKMKSESKEKSKKQSPKDKKVEQSISVEEMIYDYIKPDKTHRVKIAPIGERNFRVNVYGSFRRNDCVVTISKMIASYFFGLDQKNKLKVMAENKYN